LFFSAALLIVNFSYWKNNNITKKCEDIFYENEIQKLHNGVLTQPILNIIFYDKYEIIQDEWNFVPSEHTQNDIKNAKAIHWAGNIKPWFPHNKNKLHSHIWENFFYLLK
jgi:lipopolysaccharide biosynthesis glycosyltransferase